MELQPECLGFPVPKFKFSTIIDSLFIPLNHTGTLRENSGLAFNTFGGVESCHGKSGSISFHGLTHQLVEESKLMSAAFQEDKGSFLWVLAPIALISSLILPQFFFSSAIEAFFKDDTLVVIILLVVLRNCVLFFLGLGVFLLVTDHVQRPYLQFSAKRWGLITGLRTSQFSMKDSQRTPEMFKRGGATAGMVITFQVLAVVCLWSLMAFLQRLFPSRPVAEKY
ncbi:hypothetical protein ERO13_D05G200850v2 [Gossypium hirsutum]|uniref:Uncharacterized protein n=2 Tax=Gossypium TaxID=3633 RepID=A0A5J5RG18_GOSBA|nr:hypothetical protein ES319_D05G207500v1 [Gossypium barbadense]KAG4147079.1 hypothetical protein ERO13_D05G200850v2 [Gossypium hirsutum]TYH71920.1 hypothetical protein ES332_D05G217400v1 [Gossypium tomentosum]